MTAIQSTALEYASRIAYSSKEVLRFTFDKAREYADKPGVYVECGVAAGAQIIAMAAGAPNKTIYAFDSFEGIPLPSNKDNQYPGIRFLSKAEQQSLPNPGEQALESSGATAVRVQDFCDHVINSGVNGMNIIATMGWFEETLPKVSEKIEPISILRLDGDLYNSTYVCLKYLYHKVIKGGLIIIDDWALPGCRQAVHDYLKTTTELPYSGLKLIEDENSTVTYWTK